jgi:hypothetical protein
MNRLVLRSSLIVLLSCIISINLFSQKPARKYPIGGSYPSGANLKVAKDLDARLAKFKAVRIPFNKAGLSAKEIKLVQKLQQAAQFLDYIYWRQSDQEGLTLYKQLEGSKNPRDVKLRRYLFINGGRFDQIVENEPFVGTEHAPPGRGFYPHGITREEIEKYVKEHPEKRAELYSQFTVVRRQGNELVGVPYNTAYRAWLAPAAKLLGEAAALSDDKAFAEFLRLRADALLTDDYYKSDLAWVDLKDPKFDVVFAPYETYTDGLLGVKGAFGAAVLIRNEAESKKLEMYQQHVADIQKALPLAPEHRDTRKNYLTPMEVMNTPYRAGDYLHGYQAVATNLPNDRRIHAEKGSKKIFFKDFMDARVNYIILPLAKRMMPPEQAARASADGMMTAVIMHEISHGLGPTMAKVDGREVSINEAIGSAYSGLEEAKADVTGMFGLKWLIDKGVLPKEKLEEYYASYVAGLFRTVRFGVGEAHGRAAMMELNYLAEREAIKQENGKYRIDPAKMPDAIALLAKELLEMEATGDRARTEAWFAKYGTMPAEMKATLDRQQDIPVDVYPIYAFPEKVQ